MASMSVGCSFTQPSGLWSSGPSQWRRVECAITQDRTLVRDSKNTGIAVVVVEHPHIIASRWRSQRPGRASCHIPGGRVVVLLGHPARM